MYNIFMTEQLKQEITNYPNIYAQLAFSSKTVTNKEIQNAWEKVHPTWKEIFLNMQSTSESLSRINLKKRGF